MKSYTSAVLIAVLFIIGASAYADKPMPSAGDKLFGLVAKASDGVSDDTLFPMYEKCSTGNVDIELSWEKCQPKDPKTDAPKYDYTAFDSQSFLKSAKNKICVIQLQNGWADEIKETDPERYWGLLENFVAESAKYAGSKGVKCFAFFGNESGSGWTIPYVEQLKHVYKAIKTASESNTLMAGSMTHGSDQAIQTLYDAGLKGNFDVLVIPGFSDNPKIGVDIFQVVNAHRVMARNGDGGKQIFVDQKNQKEPSPDIAMSLENGYRNLLTERDIYDPKWIFGANLITTLKKDGSGKYEITAADSYPSGAPKHSLEMNIDDEAPIFNYVTEKPYKLSLVFDNMTGEEVTLDTFDVSLYSDKDFKIDVKPNGDLPKSVPAGGNVTGSFLLTMPKESANRQFTLIGELNYTVDGKKHFTDCWKTISVTPQLEITLIPSRMVLDPREESKKVGMSVINHTNSTFEGKISLTTSKGITATPADISTKIDSYGLEASVFTVSGDKKLAPGHYAVYIDVGNKVKDWVAIDVPLIAKKANISIDGKLDDWKDIASFDITKPNKGADGKVSNQFIGKGYLAYDEVNLYAAFEINDAKQVQNQAAADIALGDSIQIAFDPLMNGASTQSGGYKDDDYEYAFAKSADETVIYRSKAGASNPVGIIKTVLFDFERNSNKSIYEIAIPLSQLDPLKVEKNKTFGVSVLVNNSDGSGVTSAEWGGGILGKKDPRMFVPVILGE